jgi:CubicO group peptidase (beta-lactamase class C family)
MKLTLVLLALTLSAAPPATVGKTGMDQARLAEIPKRMQTFIAKGTLAGAITLVQRNGEEAALDAVGHADAIAKKPMRPDTIVSIMSMTKPFVSVCIAMLAEEGKLGLNDPVERHLPEFKGQKGGNRPITIRDLLTHTSGLATQPPKDLGWGDFFQKMDRSLADAVKTYAQTSLDFEPGTKWQYSNMGIDTLGRIVEVTSGKSFEAFLDERVLKPLGMTDSFIAPPAAKLPRIALVHNYKDGKLQLSEGLFYQGDPKVRSKAIFSAPSYGLYSTARDLAKFYQMMLNGGTYGGKRYLSKAAVATLTMVHTAGLRAGHNAGTGFGLAWEVVAEPTGTLNLMSIGSYGHGGAWGTYGWVDPKKDLVGVFLIQSSGGPDGAFARNAFMTMAASAIVD